MQAKLDHTAIDWVEAGRVTLDAFARKLGARQNRAKLIAGRDGLVVAKNKAGTVFVMTAREFTDNQRSLTKL